MNHNSSQWYEESQQNYNPDAWTRDTINTYSLQIPEILYEFAPEFPQEHNPLTIYSLDSESLSPALCSSYSSDYSYNSQVDPNAISIDDLNYPIDYNFEVAFKEYGLDQEVNGNSSSSHMHQVKVTQPPPIGVGPRRPALQKGFVTDSKIKGHREQQLRFRARNREYLHKLIRASTTIQSDPKKLQPYLYSAEEETNTLIQSRDCQTMISTYPDFNLVTAALSEIDRYKSQDPPELVPEFLEFRKTVRTRASPVPNRLNRDGLSEVQIQRLSIDKENQRRSRAKKSQQKALLEDNIIRYNSTANSQKTLIGMYQNLSNDIRTYIGQPLKTYNEFGLIDLDKQFGVALSRNSQHAVPPVTAHLEASGSKPMGKVR
ncbi:hypothetical protein V865_006583 [Kwoniella europaea PYCC6329]|uniref:BZIP domain-containing protein n=1 Tax=Kwoniella europaea PYCC6329 TaxID=1423913 RepID=A0AAX4KPM6_9TREE